MREKIIIQQIDCDYLDSFFSKLIFKISSAGKKQVFGDDLNISEHCLNDSNIIFVNYTDILTNDHLTFEDGDTIAFSEINNLKHLKNQTATELYPSDHALTSRPFNQNASDAYLQIAHDFLTYKNYVAIFNEQNINLFNKAYQLAKVFDDIYYNYPVYKNIILKDTTTGEPVVKTLLELLMTLPLDLKEKVVTQMLANMANSIIVKNIISIIISNTEIDTGFNLTIQESQVEHFIAFSKLLASNNKEIVNDEQIQLIRSSNAYKQIENIFNKNNFKMSETQQFNVLQSVGLLSQQSYNCIHNLSDMGSGKTLMTVESIFLMDALIIDQTIENTIPATLNVTNFENVYLPDKHIIAPTLSIKSSWLSTFEIFYDVTKVDDATYQLKLEKEGYQFISFIYVSSFTIKNNTLSVKSKLPETNSKNYLIIDEIHQLIKRKIPRSKFFNSNASSTPYYAYKSFILSGTMSNLNTQEWYYYCQFLDKPFPMSKLNSNSTDKLISAYTESKQDLVKRITNSVNNIRTSQFRNIDTDIENETQFYKPVSLNSKNEDPRSYRELAFQSTYAPKILNLKNNFEDVNLGLTDNLSTHNLYTNPNLLDTPNFELFYNLIGSSAITAESNQIAKEISGKVPVQHPSKIINTKSPLSKIDISVLKRIHQIANDWTIYKNKRISEEINTSILNLNDGLQTRTIYDIIATYAESNQKFLSYLVTLDINILENLQASNLINKPDIKDTQKFKVMQEILKTESKETFLIVVNDFTALVSISKALGISHLSKTELADELNYQETLDNLFEKQNIVVVTQNMIKSSLDLIQANRLIQYQLNTNISDIIQTQNRINRIGQTRETQAYYIASDSIQENIIQQFIDTYRNTKVAHKGIVELFTDISSQITIINDFISNAVDALPDEEKSMANLVNSPKDINETADSDNLEQTHKPISLDSVNVKEESFMHIEPLDLENIEQLSLF